jgi:integrase
VLDEARQEVQRDAHRLLSFQLEGDAHGDGDGALRPGDGDDFCDSSDEEGQFAIRSAHKSMINAVSAKTKALYDREWRRFQNFEARYPRGKGVPFYRPLQDASTLVKVVHFYCSLQMVVGCEWRLKSLRQAVKKGVLALGLKEDPFENPVLKETMVGWIKEYKRSRAEVRQRDPLPVSAVKLLYFHPPRGVGLPNGLLNGDAAHWPFQSRCFRDVVMLALGLRAMLRPSEAVNIKWSHVEFASPLVASMDLNVRSLPWVKLHLTVDIVGTKTTQRIVVIDPVVGEFCIVKMLMRLALVVVQETAVLSASLLSTVDCWRGLNARLGAADLLSAPVFVNFNDKHKHLKPATVSHAVKLAVDHAGLVGKFTGYSLRIGGACAVAASGAGLEVLRAIGGWSSDAVFIYIRSYVPAALQVTKNIGFGD